MILVIDAYNVLKQALSMRTISDAGKQQFIRQLAAYSKKKGHAIVCVFDGGSFEWPDKERINGVQVVHSGIHQIADEWIKNYIEQHKMYDILLISTDRELNRYAARFSVQSLDALDFYAMLQGAFKEQVASTKSCEQKAVKMSENNQPLLDELMEQASKKIITKVEDVVHKERTSAAHKLSKKERLILQKLKKL